MQTVSEPKALWGGEIGLIGVLAILGLLCLYIAAKTIEPAFAFHMALGVICAGLGLFAIFQRYSKRPAERPPLEINGLPNYNFGPVKFSTIMALFWGLAGMAVGVYIATELAFPDFNIAPWFNFGRLRPLHTSAVIFAFGGNVLLATSFYVVQRTSRARLAGDLAPWFVVLGYNFFILIAGTGYLLGITESREYAEPEWYADLWLTIVWVTYLLVFLGTLYRRKEPHIFVANWFYLAFILTIAMLHLGNNAAVPVSIFSSKSYVVWSGVQDAMFQWWYGHNAVGFFLTAGFLAIMYYFVPKRAERPIYSYRLSIIHFWALIFLYIWAGPHHLHYTALPDWTQTLGMTFSVMLWMPSWGGMINGLLNSLGRVGQAAHRSGAAHAGRVGRLLRHVDLRRSGNVDQVGELARPLHRLGGRPRALRRARLGRLRLVRRALLPRPLAVEQAGALLDATGLLALLDRDPRHRALHHLDVGFGHPAGLDVAELHSARLSRVFLHRDRRGDASLLCDPRARRRSVPRRLLPDALQRLHDDHRIRAGGSGGAAFPPAGGMRT